MIDFLSGVHYKTLPTGLILTVGGVGYSIETPLSTLSNICPQGELLELYIHTLVREDSIRLFGFQTLDEKIVFALLLSLGGVGPKVALAMLSTLGVSGIYSAALEENYHYLTSVPGIGPRSAEKILVEIKPKLSKLRDPLVGVSMEFAPVKPAGRAGEEQQFDDLRSALSNLGFKSKVINPLIQRLQTKEPWADFQGLLRQALAELGAHGNSNGGDSQLLF